MATSVKFGLTLPNRMVILGVGSIQDIISMGVDAEETGLFQSLWVGDSILAKRRPESVALLGALAGGVLGAALWRIMTLPDPLIWAGALAGLVAGGRKPRAQSNLVH